MLKILVEMAVWCLLQQSFGEVHSWGYLFNAIYFLSTLLIDKNEGSWCNRTRKCNEVCFFFLIIYIYILLKLDTLLNTVLSLKNSGRLHTQDKIKLLLYGNHVDYV